MAYITRSRETTYTEQRRVAVCDSCSKEQDVGSAEPGMLQDEGAPSSWLSVIDRQGRVPLLLFCSLECLQAYGHSHA